MRTHSPQGTELGTCIPTLSTGILLYTYIYIYTWEYTREYLNQPQLSVLLPANLLRLTQDPVRPLMVQPHPLKKGPLA